MQFFNLSLAFGLLAISLPSVFGLAIDERIINKRSDALAPLNYKNYTIVTPTWSGTIGGIAWTHNGTITEVYDSFFKVHPNVNSTEITQNVTEHGRNALSERSSLEKRSKGATLCIPVAGQGWTMTNRAAVYSGIGWLIGNGGNYLIPSRTCGRMWLGGGAGIWLCNDNYVVGINFPVAYYAGYASDIANSCVRYDSTGQEITGGQEFDTMGFNVFVRYDIGW